MLIIEKGTKAEPKPKKKAHVGSRYLCHHSPCRREANAWCDVYLYMQPRVWGGGGIFLLKCTHEVPPSWGVGRHLSLSLSLSFSLARSCSSFTAGPGVLLRCTHAPTWSSTFDNDTTAGMTRVSQCRMYLADFDAGTGLQMS